MRFEEIFPSEKLGQFDVTRGNGYKIIIWKVGIIVAQ